MFHSRAVLILVCMLAAGAIGFAGEAFVVPPLPTPEALAEAPSFGSDQPVVATHYFYWYRWPDEHFFDDTARTRSNLRHHFPDDRAVSYESPAWHKQQMQDLMAAGIDVALPVYWGAPNQYEKPELRFSVHGLPPLVQALDELAKTGRTPRIGMFYDTSTLLGGHAFRAPGHGNVDLRTDEGKDIFYRTIRDFFCQIPPRHWACIDGRPIVQLYEAAFATGHDQSTLDYVYEHFARDFGGRRPLVVAGPSWSFKADLRTGWGAALNGPILPDAGARTGALGNAGAVQIGPGYDDAPVPGRTTPTRDRLAGGYYTASWLLALQARPQLIIIETWSELHEGTDICETSEDGRYYIEWTRRYSDLFRAGRDPSPEDWAASVRLLLSGQKSNPAGREFASRVALDLHVASDGKLVEQGIRLCPAEDGVYEITKLGDTPCVRTRPGVRSGRYLYFDVADAYYYDHRGTLIVRCTYFDAGREPIEVEFDSVVETDALAGRYQRVVPAIARTDSQTWKTATAVLRGARCANRQNASADFRLAVNGADLAVSRMEVTKLRAGYGE